MSYLGIDLDMRNVPELDTDFIPMGPWMIAYEKEADRPVAIAIEREEGKVSVFETKLRGAAFEEANIRYLERYIKFCLWSVGGWKVTVCGCDEEAAKVREEYVLDGPRDFDVNFMMKVNYEYSKSVLHFCLQHRIPFLYASSASTYGSGKHGFREGDECEDALNPYAFSKLAFDRYVRQVLPEARSQIVGLKYFNVYGPQEHHKGKMASIFYQLYNQVNETGVVRLFKGIDGYKDGEQRRDFVWVGDCVDVMLWMLEHPQVNGLFNVGTGHATSYNTVAQSVARSMGVEPVIEYVDMPDSVRNQYQYFTEADLAKLRSVGYDNTMTAVPDGVEMYVGNYLSQPDIYR
jgi:ADP-L-glycero-D-manno-heptose 6-epimerase